MKCDGLAKLVNVDGNLNSAKYTQLLKNNFIPALDRDEIFQYDEAPCHKSGATEQSLAEEGVTILKDWSAQSSDLNTIAQMWTELKRRIHAILKSSGSSAAENSISSHL